MNLLDLMSQDAIFRKAASTNGGEWAGACVFCGTGHDRMRIWPVKGRYWCRRDPRHKGDAIQYLRDFRGLSFRDAKRALGLPDTRPPVVLRTRMLAEASVREHILDAYKAWQLDILVVLTDEYRDLIEELKIAEIAYRAIHRVPHFYTAEEETFWCERLSTYYDRCERLEYLLDILTYEAQGAARFAWWQEECHGGKI